MKKIRFYNTVAALAFMTQGAIASENKFGQGKDEGDPPTTTTTTIQQPVSTVDSDSSSEDYCTYSLQRAGTVFSFDYQGSNDLIQIGILLASEGQYSQALEWFNQAAEAQDKDAAYYIQNKNAWYPAPKPQYTTNSWRNNTVMVVNSNVMPGITHGISPADIIEKLGMPIHPLPHAQNHSKNIEYKGDNATTKTAVYLLNIGEFENGVEVLKIAATEENDEFANQELTGIFLIKKSDMYAPEKATPYLDWLANNGSTDIQFQLSEKFANGDEIDKNIDQAIRFLTLTANKGDATSMLYLGSLYYTEKKDFVESYSWYRKASDKGCLEAALNVADMLLKGKGTEPNVAEALKIYENAAKFGNTQAMRMLGNIYYDGEHVTKNLKTAFEWYKQGASTGDYMCQASVAQHYFSGKVVKRDLEQAKFWFGKCAEKVREKALNGDIVLQNMLGFMHEFGLGLTQNLALAVKNYKQAAEGGSKYACLNFGAAFSKLLDETKLDEKTRNEYEELAKKFYEQGKDVEEEWKEARGETKRKEEKGL